HSEYQYSVSQSHCLPSSHEQASCQARVPIQVFFPAPCRDIEVEIARDKFDLASVKTARHGLYLRGCAKRGLATRSLRACSSALLLRPVNRHDGRVVLSPFEDDRGPVGGDVEVVDNDVATEIGGAAERITFHNSRVSYPALLNQRTLLSLDRGRRTSHRIFD